MKDATEKARWIRVNREAKKFSGPNSGEPMVVLNLYDFNWLLGLAMENPKLDDRRATPTGEED